MQILVLSGRFPRDDFYSFVQASLPVVSPGASFSPNWHIEAMAFALSRVLNGEIKRLIITVPPRSLKSICASVAFPAYVLGHDPTRRIICVSYARGLARKHANDCRALMRSPLYRRLFPKTGISGAKDTELEFATTLGGNRLATSVGGTLTGRGGNIIVIDDPMKPQDAHSEAARESTKQWYSNTLLSRLDDKTKDAIVVVMQRLHLDDLVGHLLEQEGWTSPQPAGDCHVRTAHPARPRPQSSARNGRAPAFRTRAAVDLGRVQAVHGVNGLCCSIPAGTCRGRWQSHQMGLVSHLR